MPRKSTLLKQKPFVVRHREGQESDISGFWKCECRDRQACVSPRHSTIGSCGAWMKNNSKVWNGLADTRGTASFSNHAFLTLDDTICLHIYFGSYCLFSNIESSISKSVREPEIQKFSVRQTHTIILHSWQMSEWSHFSGGIWRSGSTNVRNRQIKSKRGQVRERFSQPVSQWEKPCIAYSRLQT